MKTNLELNGWRNSLASSVNDACRCNQHLALPPTSSFQVVTFRGSVRLDRCVRRLRQRWEMNKNLASNKTNIIRSISHEKFLNVNGVMQRDIRDETRSKSRFETSLKQKKFLSSSWNFIWHRPGNRIFLVVRSAFILSARFVCYAPFIIMCQHSPVAAAS